MAAVPLTVFISYRRDDAQGYAGRLADSLRDRLGTGAQVLRDVDELIAPGADYPTVLSEAIARSDAVLAVIGPRWLSVAHADGTRRIDDERDIVRLELLGALEHGITVIPVLVEQTEMPTADELPDVLAPLTTRNAVRVADDRWKADCDDLTEALARLTGGAEDANGAVDLPAPPTTLVGREHELAAVAQRFARGARLLTLTGPGGIGKTRVALATARANAAGFERIVFCDATTVDAPERAMTAIARSAGLDEPADERLVEAVARALGATPTLLLIDNFEHLVAAGPDLARLLSLAAELCILVTSRAPLRVTGEQELPIGPLSSEAAIQLFRDRAGAVRPDAGVGADAAVSQICARLDGLPLAIELAAARTRVLSPQTILEHLARRLDLLTDGAQDLPARQQTIRATIDWSYRLLDERDRALLARTSVFAGGATLDAVHAVCGQGESTLQVLNRMQNLVENSLAYARLDPAGTERFHLLELIREFAADKVTEEGERVVLRRAHAEYFGDFVERHGPRLRTADVAAAFPVFDADYPNLAEAVRWAREAGNAELELLLLGWLAEYSYFRGYYADVWPWVEHALEIEDVSPARRAALVRGAGDLRVRMGDIDGARGLFEEALRTFRELDDLWGQARSLSGLEGCYARAERFDLAEQMGAQALDIVRRLGDRPWLAFAASNAGYTAIQMGEHERAHALLAEASQVAGEIGHPEAIANIEQNRGLLAVLEGQLDKALEPTIRGLEGSLDLREHLGLLCSLVGAAAILAARGRPAAAGRLVGLVEAELELRDYVLDPVEAEVHHRTRAALASELGEAGLNAAVETGRRAELLEAARDTIGELRDAQHSGGGVS